MGNRDISAKEIVEKVTKNGENRHALEGSNEGIRVRRAWRAAPGTALDNREAKANREVTFKTSKAGT